MFLNKTDHLKMRMIDKPSLTYPPFSLKNSKNYNLTTSAACGPRAPSTIVKDTSCPSSNDL